MSSATFLLKDKINDFLDVAAVENIDTRMLVNKWYSTEEYNTSENNEIYINLVMWQSYNFQDSNKLMQYKVN